MSKKNNSIYYITSYYRSVISVVSSIVLIIYCIVGLTKKIDDYPKVTGIIAKAHLHWDKSPFTINIDSEPEQWYDIFPEEYYPILQKKVVPGKYAEIWFSPKNNSIKRLVVEGEELRPFVKKKGVNIGFIIAGSLFLLFNIIYIIRNQNNAKGKAAKST